MPVLVIQWATQKSLRGHFFIHSTLCSAFIYLRRNKSRTTYSPLPMKAGIPRLRLRFVATFIDVGPDLLIQYVPAEPRCYSMDNVFFCMSFCSF